MGNRAVILDKTAFENKYPTVGIYVHWYNEEDLRRWLAICKDREYRSTTYDPGYGMARLCQVACEDCPEGLNIGLQVIDPVRDTPRGMLLDVGFVLVNEYEIAGVIE